MHFQSGGAVRPGSFYIERTADKELYEALLNGEFCYVLAPRQMGKSSLRVRTAEKLRRKGVRCATVDLQEIGSDASIEISNWYYSILDVLNRELGINRDLQAFWAEQGQYTNEDMTRGRSTLPYCLSSFLEHEVLPNTTEPIVIFVDEIDAVLSLRYSTDDFFAVIRSVHEAQPEKADYNRLTFCLMGVAAPNDLIRDTTRTPFNIGRAIALQDFTWPQAQTLLTGISSTYGDADKFLRSVFDWTSGQPYMMQKLCEKIASGAASPQQAEEERVRNLVEETFLRKGRTEDHNLRYAENRFDKIASSATKSQLLQIYSRLLKGQHIAADTDSPAQAELRLTGLAAERHSSNGLFLQCRNRIFATVFDQAWVREKEGERLFQEALAKWLEVREWGATGDEYLLRGKALEEGLAWAAQRDDVTKEERDFLIASQEQARKDAVALTEARSARMLRALAVALAITTILAIIAGTYAASKAAQATAYAARIEQNNKELEQKKRDLEAATQMLTASNASLTEQTNLAEKAKIQAEESARALTISNDQLQQQRAAALSAQQDAEDKASQLASSNIEANNARAKADENLTNLYLAYGKQELKDNKPVSAAVYFAEGYDLIRKSGRSSNNDVTFNVNWTSQFVDPLLQLTENSQAAISPDGKHLISVDNNQQARLWDTEKGKTAKPIKELQGKFYLPNSPWAVDSRRFVLLASKGEGQTQEWIIQLRDTQTGELIKELVEATPSSFSSTMRYNARPWSDDGQRIMTLSKDRNVQLWDAQTGALVKKLSVEIGPSDTRLWVDKGRRLLTVSEDDKLQLWDAQTGELVKELPVKLNLNPFDDVFDSQFFANDGRLLVSSTQGLTLWDARTGELIKDLGVTTPLSVVSVSDDGSRLLTLSKGKVTLWEGRDGSLIKELAERVDRMFDIVGVGEQMRLLTEDSTGLKLWDAQTGRQIKFLPLKAGSGPFGSLNVDVSVGKGRRFITGDSEGVKLWDARTGELIKDLPKMENVPGGILWFEDDTWFLTMTETGLTQLWDAQTGTPLILLPLKSGYNTLRDVSLKSKRLLTVNESDNSLDLWEIKLKPLSLEELVKQVRLFAPCKLVDRGELRCSEPKPKTPEQQ